MDCSHGFSTASRAYICSLWSVWHHGFATHHGSMLLHPSEQQLRHPPEAARSCSIAELRTSSMFCLTRRSMSWLKSSIVGQITKLVKYCATRCSCTCLLPVNVDIIEVQRGNEKIVCGKRSATSGTQARSSAAAAWWRGETLLPHFHGMTGIVRVALQLVYTAFNDHHHLACVMQA